MVSSGKFRIKLYKIDLASSFLNPFSSSLGCSRAPLITYVLSCKWGLVSKRHVDDFLEVLRWSRDLGVENPDGREIKQGVVVVFAASSFNPRENVRLKDESIISLAQYAARRNLQLVTAAEFNVKLR